VGKLALNDGVKRLTGVRIILSFLYIDLDKTTQ
jgi:hypothetical protein